MSKEQTPITAEELFSEIWEMINDDDNRRKELSIAPRTILDIEDKIEKAFNAKVLEVLEEKSLTAESILETLNDMHSNDEIGYDRYTYLFDKVASIQLDETEVKPKYK